MEFCNDILALFSSSVLLRITWYFLFRTLFAFFFCRGAWTWLAGGLAGCKALFLLLSSFLFFILFDSGGFVCY